MINLAKLLQCYQHALHWRVIGHGWVYQWGAKPAPAADSADVPGSDCSGFVRWLISRATDQHLILPEGSVGQHEWCKAQPLSSVKYSPGDGATLQIAFIAPRVLANGGTAAGHVWLVRDGWSLECHGGVGVDSRHWNHPHLIGAVCACYQIETE